VLPALIVSRSVGDIFTIRLADASGALEQFWLIAPDVSDADAVAAVRAVPEVWPLFAAHSTEYGTFPVPLDSVNAFAVPLPDAVIVYALVAVLLQTHTFCALEAAVLGSWFANDTSLRPEMRARFGTDAEILRIPVDVGPSVPCVGAALAIDGRPANATAMRVMPDAAWSRLVFLIISFPPSFDPCPLPKGFYLVMVNVWFATFERVAARFGASGTRLRRIREVTVSGCRAGSEQPELGSPEASNAVAAVPSGSWWNATTAALRDLTSCNAKTVLPMVNKQLHARLARR
jgi:hypothetical protein